MNTSHSLECPSRRKEQSTFCLDIVLIVVACGMLVFTGVCYLNLKRQLSETEDAISAIEKSNRVTQSMIGNQQKRREALINERVVTFAKSRKMIIPNPGQICVISREERRQVPALPLPEDRDEAVASLPAPFLDNGL